MRSEAFRVIKLTYKIVFNNAIKANYEFPLPYALILALSELNDELAAVLIILFILYTTDRMIEFQHFNQTV